MKKVLGILAVIALFYFSRIAFKETRSVVLLNDSYNEKIAVKDNQIDSLKKQLEIKNESAKNSK